MCVHVRSHACVRACFCFNSIISIVPARRDQSFAETESFSPDQSFGESNSISSSFIHKSNESSSPSCEAAAANGTPHRMRLLLRRDKAHRFFLSGDTHLFLTFHTRRCSAAYQKREVCFLGICSPRGNLLLVEKPARMQMSDVTSAAELFLLLRPDVWMVNVTFS